MAHTTLTGRREGGRREEGREGGGGSRRAAVEGRARSDGGKSDTWEGKNQVRGVPEVNVL